MDRTLIIIPAYNEEHSIGWVIEQLRAHKNADWDLLVVNDASTDGTLNAARRSGALTIDLPFNLGIGGAVQTGFKYARDRGYSFAVQFDGDGQHPADGITELLRPLKDGTADAAVGSRFLAPGAAWKSSFPRRAGIAVFRHLITLLSGRTITDSTSGFRAYNRKALIFLADEYPEDFPEPEAVILLGKNRFRITEIPAAMNRRDSGRSSISGMKSAYYMIKVILAVLISAIKPPVKNRGAEDESDT